MFPVGYLFLFTAGEYSEYAPVGVFRVEKPLNLADLIKQYHHIHTSKKRKPPYNTWDKAKFIAWLLRNGWVSEVHTHEINMEHHAHDGTYWLRRMLDQASASENNNEE